MVANEMYFIFNDISSFFNRFKLNKNPTKKKGIINIFKLLYLTNKPNNSDNAKTGIHFFFIFGFDEMILIDDQVTNAKEKNSKE